MSFEPPRRIQWREDDGKVLLLVTHELEAAGDKTRFTQVDDATLGVPRVLYPLMRLGIGHDVTR